MTEAEMQTTIEDLERRLALARRDEMDMAEHAAKLEQRHLLVKVRLGTDLVDAVVIPPGGRMSTPVTISLTDPDEYVEIDVEPIS